MLIFKKMTYTIIYCSNSLFYLQLNTKRYTLA